MKPQDERKLSELLVVRDARRALDEKRRLLGQPPKKERLVTFHVWLPDEQIEQLKELAAERGCSVDKVIQDLIDVDARIAIIKAKHRRL